MEATIKGSVGFRAFGAEPKRERLAYRMLWPQGGFRV